MLRTHTAGELRGANVGVAVSLCGWIASRRDHKGTIFVDLRDRYGLTQCVFRHGEGEGALALEKGSELPLETCVRVTGEVTARPEGLVNPKLPTGEIEVLVNDLEVLGEAATPPLEIEDEIQASDEVRMRYRYLDLRRRPMREMIESRHRITMAIRKHLDEKGFLDVETPMLTRSTPEGARDYLVPSRERKGFFYALPQSPQIFKQLIMVAGLDRYYQIARCFRDEDLRADRQPEFTQLDVEMSFVTEEDVLLVMEELTAELFREFRGVELPRPLPRMAYREAMLRFGSDRPDLRFGVEISEFTDLLAGSEFRGFSETVASGGKVRGIAAPGGASLSRKEITALEDVARENGGKGLLWFKIGEEGPTGPGAKFLSAEETEAVQTALEAGTGDIVLLAADREKVVAQALGAVRLAVGAKLDLVPEGKWEALFVTEFPLAEWNEEEQRLDPQHHPFTAPRPEDEEKLATEPGEVLARAYDLVLNGVELGGGSIRIHREEDQRKVFAAIGLSEEEAREKFGFLMEALRYGAPPHGGFAFGLDRLLALLVGREVIREVIPFPKTTTAACPLTSAPSPVSAEQLEELGLRLEKPADPGEK